MFSSEKRKLLAEVIEDANYQAFKVEMAALGRTELRKAQRRGVPVWLPLAALFTIVAAILSQFLPRNQPLPTDPARQGSHLIKVFTEPLQIGEVVHSSGNLADVVHTSRRSAELVETRPEAEVGSISDNDLLAFLAQGPPSGGFVMIGSQKRLILFY